MQRWSQIYLCLSLYIRCRCLSLLLCMADLSYGHSGLLYSGKRNHHRRTAHLNNQGSSKSSECQKKHSTPSHSLHIGMYKGCHILPKMTIVTGTHLHHILRGAFYHRILPGPSCCSPCHQMDGRKGQVSAYPWASSVVRNGSALQHGYS